MITCHNKNGVKSICKNDTTETLVDAPIKVGGEGKSFTPFELLEASLASCIAITLRIYAQNHSLPLDDIKVTIKIDDTDAENPIAYKEIDFIGDLTEEQHEKLLKVSEACKVGKVLTKGLTFK